MKNKILLMLKQSNGSVSGNALASQLGVSRTAIWKAVNVLKADGYIIESVTNRGYRLVACPDILSAASITQKLTTQFIARSIDVTRTVDSTNLQARRAYENGAINGSLFVTEEQKGGRGRLGRSWNSPPGSGIWMSFLLCPPLAPITLTGLTLITGLAVCQAVRQATGLYAMIKWPNDIVLSGKKICGILCETSAEDERIDHVVIGIGINVNNDSFASDLQAKATSLLLESGQVFDRSILIASICNHFEPLYSDFLRNGFSDTHVNQYTSLCANIGREIVATTPSHTVTGEATGITNAGELIVRTDEGDITIHSGEVSVRGLLGYI